MAKCYELFVRFPQFKTKAVTLSFDDGDIDDRNMIEILNRYGMKCTFNLSSGKMEGNERKVQFDEINDLYVGHEIACHSYSHPHLDNLDAGGVSYQIIKDREVLEEKTGRMIEGFAYPFELIKTEALIDCIKSCGIRYGRTTLSTYNFDLPNDYLRWNPTCHQADVRLPELVQKFFLPDDVEHYWRIKPRLFYIWGHSREFRNKWENLEKICELVSKKENVWYATNMEIIDYISAFKALRRSVNSRYVYNPTDIDLYVNINGENVLIEKGKKIDLGK